MNKPFTCYIIVFPVVFPVKTQAIVKNQADESNSASF